MILVLFLWPDANLNTLVNTICAQFPGGKQTLVAWDCASPLPVTRPQRLYVRLPFFDDTHLEWIQTHWRRPSTQLLPGVQGHPEDKATWFIRYWALYETLAQAQV